jgi:hypothetical protein
VPPARIELAAQGLGITFTVICQDAGKAFMNQVFPAFSLDYDDSSTFNSVSFC